MFDRIKALWVTEPARVISFLTAVVVFVAAKAGLVVDEQGVAEALVLIVPLLLGGEVVRAKVSPATGPIGPPSDSLLPPEVFNSERDA